MEGDEGRLEAQQKVKSCFEGMAKELDYLDHQAESVTDKLLVIIAQCIQLCATTYLIKQGILPGGSDGGQQ